MPNTTRTIAPLDPFQVAAGAAPARAGVGPTNRGVSLPRPQGLPPMIALALEPKVERTISLQLVDLIDQMPEGQIKPVESIDTTRRVLLKASELEKGMATGKPTISLKALYEQVPEIFLQSVPPSELMEMPLPYEKVLAEFGNARVRADQERDQVVPQVETPILQATIEDSARFGITMEAIETCALPSVKVQPASARALAEAEPDAAVRETVAAPIARSTIKLSEPMPATPEPPRAKPDDSPSPARIPFNLPPNGAGEPASERVPALSGPPVPTRLPKIPAPKRNPFKTSAPSDDLRPKLRLVPGMEQPEEEEADEFAPPPKAKAQDDVKMTLPLQPVLQNIPPFQLSGSTASVPDDARISLPLSLIQPQLASGRIAIEPKVFQAALPEQFRDLLVIDTSETPIMLPLQEVLKNLPGAALQMREDQEEAEKGIAFETPFSIKAKEDAARFKVSDAPIAKPVVASEPAADDKIDSPSGTGTKIDKEPEEKLDAKEVVVRASALEGVAGCSVTFSDGLSLAGNLPADVAVEGLCAMAPSLLHRIEQHMLNTKLGALSAMTLHGDKSAVTFFMQGNICLTALHASSELGAEAQGKLAEMARKLSRTYAQPETAHVDH